VSPVKYGLGFYIPEDDILHSHCRDNLKSYIQDPCVLYPLKHNYFENDDMWDECGCFDVGRNTSNALSHSVC
jgi:hypothetical protein